MNAYREYLLGSRGELSIAKNVYVATRSGWFSTRSAAYLACGKPVVVQETGFSAHVPTGPGLHAFATAEEAVAALEAIRSDYARACRHAREVAEAYFDAERVCERLIADAGL
jgi:glycosyltransferase involved in cell wall biosynthesis